MLFPFNEEAQPIIARLYVSNITVFSFILFFLMSESWCIHSFHFLFFISSETVCEVQRYGTGVERTVHIQILSLEANFLIRHTGVEYIAATCCKREFIFGKVPFHPAFQHRELVRRKAHARRYAGKVIGRMCVEQSENVFLFQYVCTVMQKIMIFKHIIMNR